MCWHDCLLMLRIMHNNHGNHMNECTESSLFRFFSVVATFSNAYLLFSAWSLLPLAFAFFAFEIMVGWALLLLSLILFINHSGSRAFCMPGMCVRALFRFSNTQKTQQQQIQMAIRKGELQMGYK